MSQLLTPALKHSLLLLIFLLFHLLICRSQGWSTQQVSLFLEYLLTYVEDVAPFSEQVLLSLNGVYGFTKSGNAEIRFRWQSLCLQSDVAWIGVILYCMHCLYIVVACCAYEFKVPHVMISLSWLTDTHIMTSSFFFSSLHSSGCDRFRDVTRAHEVRTSAVQSTDAVQERQRCSDSNVHEIQEHVSTC